MRFLIDRCAGRKLAEWLRSKGHDVLESRTLGPDPGDRELLKKAAEEAQALADQLGLWKGAGRDESRVSD